MQQCDRAGRLQPALGKGNLIADISFLDNHFNVATLKKHLDATISDVWQPFERHLIWQLVA